MHSSGRWILLGIVLGALLLRLPEYTRSVWFDELFTSNEFCGDPIILAKTLFSDIHPPAYFLFMHVWNSVFGDREIFLRLPPLLSGLFSILLIARIGTLLGGRATGLVAASLLAVSPVHIWYSREGRPYATNLMLVLLAVLMFQRLLSGPRRPVWWILYGLSLAGAVFTHYYMAIFLFVFAAIAMGTRSPATRRVLWINGTILVVLGIYMAAKSWFSEVPTGKGYLRAFDLGELWQLHFNWFLTGNSLTPLGEVTAVGVALLVVVQVFGLLASVRGVLRTGGPAPVDRRVRMVVLFSLLALPAFLLGLAVIGLDRTYIERSALPGLPFFLLLIAAGLTGWHREVHRRASIAVTVVLTTVVAFAFYSQPGSWTVYKPNPDWRAAAAHLGASLEDSDTADRQLLLSAYVSPTALTYYDPRIQQMKHFEPNDQKRERLIARAEKLFGSDGFPGTFVHQTIRGRLEVFERKMLALQLGTRIEVHHLPAYDPLDPANPIPPTFWLIVHGPPDQHVVRVLSDPRIAVIEEQRFRELLLYRLRIQR